MTSIAEQFVLLDAYERPASGTQLLTRSVQTLSDGQEVLLALDERANRHLLIPCASERVAPDHASQGVTLGPRRLTVDNLELSFIDLHCRLPALDLVFERLVEDVLLRIGAEGLSPLGVCRRVLGEWRDFLSAAGQPVSRETIIGLAGELEVLRLMSHNNPDAALESWWGPASSVHDFVSGGSELEVKTTASVDGNFISISNLDQLDPTLMDQLHLIVVHLRQDESGESLDDRIRNLLDIGTPRDILLRKVSAAGYTFETDFDSDLRFTIRSVRAWNVGDSFPGLRRAEIKDVRLNGVGKIHYELAIDTAPKALDDERFANFLLEWTDDRD